MIWKEKKPAMKVDMSRLQCRLMLLILLMVVPLLAASVQNGFSQRKAMVQQIETQGLDLLGYMESAMSMGLKRNIETIAMVVLGEGEDFDIEAKQRAIDKIVAKTGNRLDIAIIDDRGRILASSTTQFDSALLADEEHLQEALLTGQISFGVHKPDHTGGRPGVLLLYPVIGADNSATFVVAALLYEELLFSPLSNVDLPADVAFELVDLNWDVVAHRETSDKALGLTASPDLGDVRQKLAFSVDGGLSEVSKWEDGVKRLAGIKTVTDYRGNPVFYVTATMPIGADLTRATILSFYQVVVMLGVSLIVIPVTRGLMNKQFVEPVNRLVDLAEDLGSGHMDARHGEPYEAGEVGELAKAFDEMAEALKERSEELEYLSFHDSLTGAYNRTYIESISEELACEENLPTTIILGDINGLKMVNDTYGHQAGNELIVRAGAIIQQCVGDSGVVARWGGDEFIIVLPNAPMRSGLLLCNRIRSACESSGHYPMAPSIALGVATRMAAEQSIMDTLVSAESRMYRNKFLDTSSARGTLLYSLRRALAESTHETEEHSSRMCFLALELGSMIGLSSNTLDDLAILASFHDIGKIGIPDSILQKPGPLTDEEWKVMKAHPEIGARIVGGSYELSHISESILSHHERWDGEGYPEGVGGDEIPLISRILAIVDAYDAMTSDRTYRKAMSREEALAEIARCSGTQFDPDLVEMFLTMMEEMARSEENEMDWLTAGMQWYEGLGDCDAGTPKRPGDKA